MQDIETVFRAPTVPELSSQQRLMLWGIRHWVRATLSGVDPCQGLEAAFQRFGVQNGAARIGLLMAAAVSVWPEPFRVAPPCCRQPVTTDEHTVLRVLALAGRGDLIGVHEELRDLLPTAACEHLFAAGQRAALAFLHADMGGGD
ncbi:MAG: hypothetical protein E6R12_03380 [Sphingomonadales bacterium]|nr:MAG: hypothetical protein E6R12_03380 [Sphingomonadales bacterium]